MSIILCPPPILFQTHQDWMLMTWENFLSLWLWRWDKMQFLSCPLRAVIQWGFSGTGRARSFWTTPTSKLRSHPPTAGFSSASASARRLEKLRSDWGMNLVLWRPSQSLLSLVSMISLWDFHGMEMKAVLQVSSSDMVRLKDCILVYCFRKKVKMNDSKKDLFAAFVPVSMQS